MYNKISSVLDKIADSLESKGHFKLASEVDVIANTLESVLAAWYPERDIHINAIDKLINYIRSSKEKVINIGESKDPTVRSLLEKVESFVIKGSAMNKPLKDLFDKTINSSIDKEVAINNLMMVRKEIGYYKKKQLDPDPIVKKETKPPVSIEEMRKKFPNMAQRRAVDDNSSSRVDYEELDFGDETSIEDQKKEGKRELLNYLSKGLNSLGAEFNPTELERAVDNAESDPVFKKGCYVFNPKDKSSFTKYLEGLYAPKKVTMLHIVDGQTDSDYGWMSEDEFKRKDRANPHIDYMVKDSKEETAERLFFSEDSHYKFHEEAQAAIYKYMSMIRRLDSPDQDPLEDLSF